jgi:hypothetical protein
MNSPRVTYRPREDATPEAELNAVAYCYRFILFGSSASKKEAVEPTPSSYAAARVKHEKGGESCRATNPIDHQRSHAQRHSSRKIPASADISSPLI